MIGFGWPEVFIVLAVVAAVIGLGRERQADTAANQQGLALTTLFLFACALALYAYHLYRYGKLTTLGGVAPLER